MDLVETLSNVVVIIAAFSGAFLAALWLSLVIWTFRDIRSRSRDVFAQILATLVVAILTLPGIIIYVMVRPRETLAEAYDRSLEEEALLQSIEERESCPGCGQRADEAWILCPYCHTRLKKHCHHCGQTLRLNWTVCPYCGTSDRPVAKITPSVEPPAEVVAPADTTPPENRVSEGAEPEIPDNEEEDEQEEEETSYTPEAAAAISESVERESAE
jgi:hypothetical protein